MITKPIKKVLIFIHNQKPSPTEYLISFYAEIPEQNFIPSFNG